MDDFSPAKNLMTMCFTYFYIGEGHPWVPSASGAGAEPAAPSLEVEAEPLVVFFPREEPRVAPGGQGEAHGQHRLLPEVGQQLAGREEGHRREAAEKHLGQDGERQGLLWGPGDQAEGARGQKKPVGTPGAGRGPGEVEGHPKLGL